MMTRIFVVVMLSVVTLSVVLLVGMTPFSEPRVTKLFFSCADCLCPGINKLDRFPLTKHFTLFSESRYRSLINGFKELADTLACYARKGFTGCAGYAGTYITLL